MPKGYFSALLVLLVVNWVIGYGIVYGLLAILRHIHWAAA